MQQMTIHECTFYYDPAEYREGDYHSAWGAIHHWQKYLDHSEISTLFHAAKANGHANFENNHNNEYRLSYEAGAYTVSYHPSN
jgi:hypothetical protein